MSGRCVPSRANHLKPNNPDKHETFGVAKILGEWGSIPVDLGKATRVSYPCPGIYDCEFGTAPNRVLHCCRVEYLERIAKAPVKK
jgi:hypothetical protein